MSKKSSTFLAATALALAAIASPGSAQPKRAPSSARPNILVIMMDDFGITNTGAYSHGMMVPTPNIDRIAREGMLFTDHYSEPTCTPGRAAFITGQLPIRTGLTTVGLPGSPVGLDPRDPTLAEVLKPLGYATGQFGKNHLGDRNEHLPTVHGFDEFYGNLYHLNAEEEPEDMDWPKDAAFNGRFRPRGVLDCVALPADNPAPADARFGVWGKQRCTDTGALTRKRMETVDEEFQARTLRFIEKAKKDGKPFFVWHNPSRMHVYTHLKPESRYLAAGISSGDDIHGSGVMEADAMIGQILKRLDELGIADNTIVVFTADNGAWQDFRPDGGVTPFRAGKSSTWEGGVRVPMLIRWPARIKAGSVSNGIQANYDLFTTLAAAAGDPNVADRLRVSHKVHIDGVNNLAHWTGGAPSARNHVVMYNENVYSALRIGPWKVHSKTRSGFFDPLIDSALMFNLRMDPFETMDGKKAGEFANRKGNIIAGLVTTTLEAHFGSLAEFPPRQASGTLRPGADTVKVPDSSAP